MTSHLDHLGLNGAYQTIPTITVKAVKGHKSLRGCADIEATSKDASFTIKAFGTLWNRLELIGTDWNLDMLDIVRSCLYFFCVFFAGKCILMYFVGMD